MRIGRHVPLLVLAAVAAALLLLPPGLERTGILVGFAILSWTFGIFAEPVTTLVFFAFAVLFQVAKPAVVFSGFATTAWWLVFGGSIVAVAVETTGLGRRLAGLLFDRLATTYPRAVTAVALVSIGLAFVMPSTAGRVLLLMPIVLALAERLGLAPGSAGHGGLVAIAAAASYMPATSILTANVPNSILLGEADALYGVKLTYGPYLLLHFPILGALKAALLIGLVCLLFPERGALARPSSLEPGPWSRAERRLAAVLVVSLGLFATDFIHGVSPAWIALGTGIACLLPELGILAPATLSRNLNFTTLVYIAGFLGVASVVSASGLGAAAGASLLRLAALAPGHGAQNVASLTAIGGALGMLTTVSAAPALLTPLAGSFADASGLPILTVLMLQVWVFSTPLVPFEAPPMMIGLQLGGLAARAATPLCLAAASVTVVALLPLDYLWWRLLGYLP